MTKNKKILTKIITIVTSFLVVISLLIVGSKDIISTTNKIDKSTSLSNEVWNSSLSEIDSSIQVNTPTYIRMNSFIGNNETVLDPTTIMSDSSKEYIIVIGTAIELYYFTLACNSKTVSGNSTYKSKYLTYHYILGNDIDYNDAAKNYKFVSPIGWGKDTFTGTFDGMGFVISNLFYKPIATEAEYLFFQEAEYSLGCYSLFSVVGVGGVVKNIGLVNVIILQPDLFGTMNSASSLIGENYGTVSHIYVHDFRGNNAGLTVENGFYAVSGLMVYNYGIFESSYVAINKVISSSVSHQSQNTRYTILYANNGGIVKDVFYDSTILYDTITLPKRIENNTDYVEDNVIALTTTQFSSTEYFPYYTDEEHTISNNWFGNISYPSNYRNSLNLKYPILLGFKVNTINNSTYFEISRASDISYMSRLIALYGVFRGADYRLINSIDLASITEEAIYTSNASFTGTFQSVEKEVVNGEVIDHDGYGLVLKNGTKSKYNSIFNLTISTGSAYGGYNCFGFFQIFSGVCKNINFVNARVKLLSLDGKTEFLNTNCVGVVCGKQEGGLIENVNVYGTIILTTKDSNNTIDGTSTTLNKLSRTYVGGIVGYSTLGNISECTTNGVIDGSYQTKTTGTAGINGSSIGGIVGRVDGTNSISNCLNNMNIYAMRFSSSTDITGLYQYVGGIIGSGKTNIVEEIENDGTITLGVSGTTYRYGIAYVGGVIGIHQYSYSEVGSFLNNGNINVYIREVVGSTLRISGVLNCENSKDRIALKYSSLSNRGLLNIVNDGGISPEANYVYSAGRTYNVSSGIDLKVCGVIYTNQTNTVINGVYNFNKKYVYINNEKVLSEAFKQNIDISIIWRFAPCIMSDNILDANIQTMNVVNNDTGTYTNVKQSYNYRDINYGSNYPINFYNLVLSGNCVGLNFNLDNIRNDGKVFVNFTTATNGKLMNAYSSNISDYKKLKVFGCFEEVSMNCYAKNIYNGGNIEVTSATNIVVVYNVYMSGICYKNGNSRVFLDNNLSTDDVIMNDKVDGTVHNCVNNGDISIHGGAENSQESGKFYGVCRGGGITSVNASILSSCFNLGNFYCRNNVQANGNTNGLYVGSGTEFEVEIGGICFLMLNSYAQIKDSANTGNIYSMNTADISSWINASGIAVRNDKDEAGNDLGNTGTGGDNDNPDKQKIEFSINYGTIIAYNEYDSEGWTAGEPQAKAAGFLCLGVCSIVNVINYGDIYSTRVAGGMYGLVFLQKFIDVIETAHPVYIANAINYGTVAGIKVGTVPTLDNLSTIGSTSNYNSNGYNSSTNSFISGYTAGALIGYIEFDTDNITIDKISSTILISYLINFNENIDIVGKVTKASEISSNAQASTVQNFLKYMATTKVTDGSPLPFARGTYGTINYGIKSYSKDTKNGTYIGTTLAEQLSQEYNGGIFNETFPLRDASNTDQSIITNQYIADFIQFVPFSKVNEYLINKIGLDEAIYQESVQMLLLDIEAIYKCFTAVYDGTEGDITNTIMTGNSTIRDAVYSNVEYNLFILNKMYENHQGTQEFYNILVNLLSDENISNTTITEMLSDQRFITLLTNIIQDENVTISMKNTLISTLINNKDCFGPLANTYPDEVNAILGTYLSILVNDPTTNMVEIETLFNLINNEETFSSIVGLMPTTEVQTMFSTIFGDNSIVSDIKVDYFYNLLDNSSKLSSLDSSNISTVYNDYLNDTYITADRLNNIKGNFGLDNTGYTKILSNYYNCSNTSEKVLFDAIIDKLDSTQFKNLWNYVYQYHKDFGYFFLKADSLNYAVYVSSQYFYANRSGYNDTYTGPYRLTGTYDPRDGDVFSTGAYSSYSEMYFQYGQVSTPPIASSYPYASITSNQLRRRTSYSNGYYSRSTQNNYSYIYYSTSGNNYIYQSHGEYFRFNALEFNTAVQNNKISLDNYKIFFKDVYYPLNSNVAISELFKYSSMSTVFSTGTSDLEGVLKDSSLNLTDNEKLNIIIAIENAYGENLSVSIPSASNRSDKIKGIASYANTNNVFYYNIFNDATYGIKNDITAGGKIQFINDYIYYDSAGYIRTAVGSRAFANVTDKDLWIIRGSTCSSTMFNETLTLLLGATNSDNVVSYSNICDLISLIIEANPSAFKTYVIPGITLTNNDKLAIAAAMSYYDAYQDYYDSSYSGINIFKNLMSLKGYDLTTSSTIESEFKDLCNIAGINYTTYTDYIGIYALASSSGIEQGEFLPDNINMIKMDIYNGDVNDPTWRGGTNEEVNNYYVIENGAITSTLNTTCVNYKVYYMMKQLKKSIATSVFKIELTGPSKTEFNKFYTAKNDVTTCYDLKNRVITFYLASNADEIDASNFVVNTLSNYELSYNAIFKEGSINQITVPNNINVGDTLTSKVNNQNTYAFIIQAEDRTVETMYYVNVIITAQKRLDSITNLQINNSTNYAVTEITSINEVDISGNDYVDVAASGGSLKVTYTTINLPNSEDMKNSINIYKYNGTSVSESCINSNKITNYSYTDDTNNGRVIVNQVGDSAFNTDYTWDDGQLIVNLNIGSDLLSGIYILEVKLCASAIYRIVFEKAKSTAKSVELITCGNQPYVPTGTSNVDDPSIIKFGSQLTLEGLTAINPETGIPYYLNELVISPLASFAITSVNVNATDVNSKIYTILYTITAEDLSTSTFTHYLQESDVDSNSLLTVYTDGSVTDDSPTSESNQNYNSTTNTYSVIFGKDKTPAFRFIYNLDEAYFSDKYVNYNVGDTVEAGTKINRLCYNGLVVADKSKFVLQSDGLYMNLSEFISSSSFTTATNYLHVEYDGTDLSLEEQQRFFDIEIEEGGGFVVSFNDISPAKTYKFKVYYESGRTIGINTYPFSENNSIGWYEEYTSISITKDKNVRSYLDNVTFITETMLTTINTLVSVNEITTSNYEELRNSTNREIVCLPSGIYYNQYEYSSDNLTNHEGLIYVVGLVSKTNLSNYSPTFTLPDDAKIYKICKYYTNTSSYVATEKIIDCNFVTYQVGDTVPVNTMISEEVYNLLVADKGNYSLYATYKYTPYIYIDSQGLYQNIVFMVSEDGLLFKKSSGEDIIVNGDVNRFVYDGVTYTLSNIDGLESIDLVFNKLRYIDSSNNIVYFYYNEEKNVFLNSDKSLISVSGTKNSFIFNSNSYIYDTTQVNETIESSVVTFENVTLESDFNPKVGIEGLEFNYVLYRVYSEKYTDNQSSDYYTDYMVAIQDITNNIRFDITIKFDSTIDLSTVDPTFRLYLELLNLQKNETDGSYVLEETYEYIQYSYVEAYETKHKCFYVNADGTLFKDEDGNSITITSGNKSSFVYNKVTYVLNTHFLLNNRMGLFANYQPNEIQLSHGIFTTNTSGCYGISINMPDGYSFNYVVTDPDDIDNPINGLEEDKFFIIADALLSRIIKLDIIITSSSISDTDWGQHLETDLLNPSTSTEDLR